MAVGESCASLVQYSSESFPFSDVQIISLFMSRLGIDIKTFQVFDEAVRAVLRPQPIRRKTRKCSLLWWVSALALGLLSGNKVRELWRGGTICLYTGMAYHGSPRDSCHEHTDVLWPPKSLSRTDICEELTNKCDNICPLFCWSLNLDKLACPKNCLLYKKEEGGWVGTTNEHWSQGLSDSAYYISGANQTSNKLSHCLAEFHLYFIVN